MYRLQLTGDCTTRRYSFDLTADGATLVPLAKITSAMLIPSTYPPPSCVGVALAIPPGRVPTPYTRSLSRHAPRCRALRPRHAPLPGRLSALIQTPDVASTCIFIRTTRSPLVGDLSADATQSGSESESPGRNGTSASVRLAIRPNRGTKPSTINVTCGMKILSIEATLLVPSCTSASLCTFVWLGASSGAELRLLCTWTNEYLAVRFINGCDNAMRGRMPCTTAIDERTTRLLFGDSCWQMTHYSDMSCTNEWSASSFVNQTRPVLRNMALLVGTRQ